MAVYNEDDAAALCALVTRYTRLWHERDRDQKLKAELEARLGTYPEKFQQMRSAFAIFGVTGLVMANWDKLKEDLGERAYYAAVAKADIPLRPAPPDENSKEPKISENDEFKLDEEFQLEEDEKDDVQKTSGTVREIVIERLRAAGSKGSKAADLRSYIETVRGAQLHEKTVGMTLYRLQKDGLALRNGRTWFFVPPKDETKNPGAATPGSNNSQT